MTRQMSFSRLEQDLRGEFREKMNAAESTEDVKKFFARTAGQLLKKVLGDNVDLQYEDIQFDPCEKDGYVISKGLRKMEGFASVWRDSDLPHIIKTHGGICLETGQTPGKASG